MFKPGDRVKCVDCFRSDLKHGDIYIVMRFYNKNIWLENYGGGWSVDRFVLDIKGTRKEKLKEILR